MDSDRNLEIPPPMIVVQHPTESLILPPLSPRIMEKPSLGTKNLMEYELLNKVVEERMAEADAIAAKRLESFRVMLEAPKF
jgi:hypothetical protein